MAKNSSMAFVEDFAFYEQLWFYYSSNRGKIRSRYNDLTKKFLAYNDKNENPYPAGDAAADQRCHARYCARRVQCGGIHPVPALWTEAQPVGGAGWAG